MKGLWRMPPPFCPFNLFWLRNDGQKKTEAKSKKWKTSMFQQNCRLYFPRPNATSANATNVTPSVTVTEAEVPKSYSKKIGDEKMVCMDHTLPETHIFAPNITGAPRGFGLLPGANCYWSVFGSVYLPWNSLFWGPGHSSVVETTQVSPTWSFPKLRGFFDLLLKISDLLGHGDDS